MLYLAKKHHLEQKIKYIHLSYSNYLISTINGSAVLKAQS